MDYAEILVAVSQSVKAFRNHTLKNRHEDASAHAFKLRYLADKLIDANEKMREKRGQSR